MICYRARSLDPQINSTLNTVYHWIMTLSEKYQLWYKSMAKMKSRYLERNMEQIFSHPAIVEEIMDEVRLREDAERTSRDPNALGLSPVSEKTIANLRAYLKKQKLLRLARQKTRFRREHTV